MYYSNDSRGHEPWENPIETTGRPVDDPPRRQKKGGGAKVAALCLVCALVGGMVGGGGVAIATGALDRGSTTIYEGTRTPTTVSVANITGSELLTAPEIYAAYVGSTVGITTEIVTTNGWGQPVSSAAAGSGFVITQDGYILTNYHVIEDANSIQVAFVDGTTYDAELVGGEEENDIAVLKINATGLTPVIIGDSDNVRVGEQVVAIGNPLGELTYSMTQGIISARDRSITMENGEVMNMLQTDTAINSGNSGGPLFDMYGQVIGITSAKLSGSSSSSATIEGLGFAIPINDVKDMVADIMENGYVTGKPYLGITVSTVPQTVAERYGISQGALVESVDPASCAAAAGLQEGDIITALNGTTVVSSAELIEQKKNYQAGDTVTMEVERDGASLTLTLTFDEDTPERRAAQEEVLEQQQQETQQQEQQNSGGYDFFWPFGDLSPWFY
ncbi:trypsin-like peptidase domain-containing protein [uncultured Intestinimonas sp.]|uniref:S1C family serine protease n=1 Tax=uncultured Intestinimonas sp. TaxID=1689265 RepID=UPI0025E6DE63|nr:trypsin-like peptidase domain-containing protein [uncultured Intestinimonas sp.]